jgi:hypothetical protein
MRPSLRLRRTGEANSPVTVVFLFPLSKRVLGQPLWGLKIDNHFWPPAMRDSRARSPTQ